MKSERALPMRRRTRRRKRLFALLLATGALSLFSAVLHAESESKEAKRFMEPRLTFHAPRGPSRTAGMCGPSHDVEVVFGRGANGRNRYFAFGTDVLTRGIPIWESDDLTTWSLTGAVFSENNPPLFSQDPDRPFHFEFAPMEIGPDRKARRIGDFPEAERRRHVIANRPFWAPCVYFHEKDQTYYLYYCCSVFGERNSFIGCAKSKALDRGWIDCGLLVLTWKGDGRGFNAIDPVVTTDANGDPWMAYGSFFGGIAILRLDPDDPSKLLEPGTFGTTIACRDAYETLPEGEAKAAARLAMRDHERTAYGQEGASLLWNPDTGFYYLFLGFDNLTWSYHTRVGRSKSIDGPYFDRNGNPLVYHQETAGRDRVHGTKLVGPYLWTEADAGWMGLGHSTVFRDKHGNILFGSNAKWDSGTSYLFLRKTLWSDDGWPLLSPCVYAGEDVAESLRVPVESIVDGAEECVWEFLVFRVDHDPDNKRIDASNAHVLKRDGSFAGEPGHWKAIAGPNGTSMSVTLPNGVAATGKCLFGWDQDRRRQTVAFTGLTDAGVPVWGQRIGRREANASQAAGKER